MMSLVTRHSPLAARGLTYRAAGATRPEVETWQPPAGFRSYEATTAIGRGESDWRAATAAALTWTVKTRSGFAVAAPGRSGHADVQDGERYWLVARFGPVRFREPVQVVATVMTDNRRGFAYGTLDGHPVSGEEAFILHRSPDGSVWFTLRSLTRPGRGRWRTLFPAALIAQRCYRRRYARALVPISPTGG
jgi:uncharacterized protein (UPF0548 family)